MKNILKEMKLNLFEIIEGDGEEAAEGEEIDKPYQSLVDFKKTKELEPKIFIPLIMYFIIKLVKN